jgi:hypothetical protein
MPRMLNTPGMALALLAPAGAAIHKAPHVATRSVANAGIENIDECQSRGSGVITALLPLSRSSSQLRHFHIFAFLLILSPFKEEC